MPPYLEYICFCFLLETKQFHFRAPGLVGNKEKAGRKRGKFLFARYNAGIAVWAILELSFDFIYDFCGKSNRKIIARRKQSADKTRALPVGQGF